VAHGPRSRETARRASETIRWNAWQATSIVHNAPDRCSTRGPATPQGEPRRRSPAAASGRRAWWAGTVDRGSDAARTSAAQTRLRVTGSCRTASHVSLSGSAGNDHQRSQPRRSCRSHVESQACNVFGGPDRQTYRAAVATGECRGPTNRRSIANGPDRVNYCIVLMAYRPDGYWSPRIPFSIGARARREQESTVVRCRHSAVRHDGDRKPLRKRRRSTMRTAHRCGTVPQG